MEVMEGKIKRGGNELLLVFPNEMIKKYNLQEGQKINYFFNSGKCLIFL